LRTRRTLTELDEKLVAAGEMWGGADYEQIARRFAPIHEEVVGRLAPSPNDRWLDVATGTGEVALRAAREGASVAGFDLSRRLIAQARAKAEAVGLPIDWEVGSADSLPYEDETFDVVSSCFGVIFVPDQNAAATELARVCRAGGRLALTAWRPRAGLHAIYERFSPGDAFAGADEWGREARVEELLGGPFHLEIEERVWHLTGESPEAVYELMSGGAPPVKALLATLAAEQRIEFRSAMLEYWQEFRTDAGVDEPREYLLVVGGRR
jgi:SAM-dependent methyltransferase